MTSKVSAAVIVGLGTLLGISGFMWALVHLLALGRDSLGDDALVGHGGGLVGAILMVALARYCVRSGRHRLRLATGGEHALGQPPGRPRLGLLGGALTLLVVAGIAPSGAGSEPGQYRIAVAEMQRTVESVRRAASAGVPITTSPSVLPVAAGEAGQMELVFKSALARAQAEGRSYLAEIEASGWSKVLDPDRLKADPASAGSRAMIRQVREIIARHRARMDATYAAARRDIEAANLRADTRRTALAALDKGAERNKAQAAAAWDLEEQLVGEIEAVVELLGSRQGAWQARSGKFVFQRSADLDLFNAQMKKVSAALGKQRQMELDRLQLVSDSLAVVRR